MSYKTKSITFLKEGEKPEKDHSNQNRSYMDTANGWEVKVDLKGRISESTKQLGIIEVT